MREIRHLDMLARTVPLAGKRVLDIGSGKGGLVVGLAAAGAMPVGVEPQEALARAAGQSCPAGCLGFVAGDGSALPFADNCFDLTLFFFSLHHIPQADMAQALTEAGRVTRVDGRVYVAEPLAEGKYFELIRQVHDETAARAHALAALAQASQAGLRAIEQFTYLCPMAFASAEVFLEWLTAPDPNRSKIVAELRPALVARFYRDADRQGTKFTFRQPVRVNLFAVASQ